MEYLYAERQLGAPASGILLTDKHILTFHHSTLRLFDLNFALIQEKYFYERILSINKIDDEQFIILFNDSKAVQLTYSLTPICFRVLGGTFISSFHGLVSTLNISMLYFFMANDSEIHEISLAQFNLSNIQQFTLLDSFIPTAVLISNSNRCSLISLFNKKIVEEFDILNGILSVHSFDKLLVFIYTDYLQLRYNRELFTLAFNDKLPAPGSVSTLPFKMLNPAAKTTDKEIECEMALINPKAYMVDNILVIINGDGTIYRFKLRISGTAITEINIERIGRTSIPTGLSIVNKCIAISSIEEDSLLCSIEEDGKLKERGRCFSGGKLTGLTVKPNGNVVYTTTKGILSTMRMVDFKIIESNKIDGLPVNLQVADNKIVLDYGNMRKYYSKDGLKEINSETEKRNEITDEIEVPSKRIKKRKTNKLINEMANRLEPDESPEVKKVLENYTFLYYKSKKLVILSNNNKIASINGVSAFSFISEFVCYVSGSTFFIRSLPSLKIIFLSNKIYEFANRLESGEFRLSENLVEVLDDDHVVDVLDDGDGLIEDFEDGESKDSAMPALDEILLFKSDFVCLFLRLGSRVYLYKLCEGALIKQFIPYKLSFKSPVSGQLFWNLGSFVYINSTPPYCAFLRNGVYFHASRIRMDLPVSHGRNIFFIHRGMLARTRLPSSSFSLRYDSSLITEQIITHFGDPAPTPSRLPDKLAIHRVEPGLPMEPNNLVFLDDCVVVAVSGPASFFYVPFIPMVHMAGADGQLVSEPIHKDVPLNSNPVVLGRTLRHRVCLFSLSFQYISEICLEENEFVCDIKHLFDEFLVICTSFCEGEDKFSKGRILIYLVTDIVPDPSHPHICKRFKLVAEEQLRSPCFACAGICGLLAVCVGTRLMIYEIDINNGITAVGRNEIAILSTDIFVIKNYMFISDIYNGAYLYFLRPNNPLHINLLGRTTSKSCLSNGSISPSLTGLWNVQGAVYKLRNQLGIYALNLITYSMTGSISIYTYSPRYIPSNGGNLLIRRCEINTKIKSDGLVRGTQLDAGTCLFLADSITVSICPFENNKAFLFVESVAYLIDNSLGINPRNYLTPISYLNIECGSAVPERILLEYQYMSPKLQTKVLGMTGMTSEEVDQMYDDIYREC